MAQLLIRNLDDALKQRLRRQAERHGVSMEAEARAILCATLMQDKPAGKFGSRAAALFAGHGLHADEHLPELRGIARSAEFE